jgi:intein/homing endonuclease
MAEIPSWGDLLGGAEGRGGPAFPKTGSVFQGMKKRAEGDPVFRTVLAADMARLAPEIRNPLLSSVNFFIPPERSVLNQWIRYYYRFHPLVSNIINLHSELPMSRFGLKDVKDPAHLSFYEEMVEEMDLFLLLLDILKEYHLLGEAFPFLYWEDEFNCFTAGELINPDFIDVRGHPLVRGGEKAYRFELIPDQTIRDFVSSNHPDDIELRQSLDPEIIGAISSGKNIRLDPFNVSIIAKKQHRYEPRGTSMVLSCFLKGTEVMNGLGIPIPIEDIEVGESVWTHRGRLRKVTDTVHLEYKGPIVKIKTVWSDKPIATTVDHNFWVYSKKCPVCGKRYSFEQLKTGRRIACSRSCNAKISSPFLDTAFPQMEPEIELVEAGSLSKGDVLIVPYQTEFYEEPLVSPGKARLLGYFLAEGSFSKKNYVSGKKRLGLVFSFCKDEEHTWVKDVIGLLDSEWGIPSKSCFKKGRNSITVKTRKALRKYECVEWMYQFANEHSHEKHLPSVVLKWPPELQEQILVGFCRGDGSWKNGSGLSCTTVSKVLARQLSKMAFNLGLPHRFSRIERRGKATGPSYTLYFPGSLNSGFIEKVSQGSFRKLIKSPWDSYNRVFDLRSQGHTIKQIGKILSSEKVKTIEGGKWSPIAISKILRGVKYGIKGKGVHVNVLKTDKYILIPITGIKKFDYKGSVYCLVVDQDHSFALGNGVVTRNCLKDLLYEDKLREAQYSIAEGHITPKQIWKIGDKDHMPLQEDLEDFRELLISANNDPIFSIVTHYGVQADFVGSAGKVLPLLPEFEFVYNRVLTGLFANKSLIHGEGVNYQNASVGLRVLMSRYIAIRGKLEDWARTKIFMPVAIANDFYHISQADLDHNVRTNRGEGERKLDLPQFDWRSKQNLLDDSLQKQLLMQLLQRTKIPMKVVAEAMDIEYDYLKKWLKSEEGTVFDEVYQKRRDELSKQRMTERIKMAPTVETTSERSGPSDSIDVGTDVMGVTEEPAPETPEAGGAPPEAGAAPEEAAPAEAAPAAPGGEAGAAAGKIIPVMKSKDQTMLEKGEPHTEHKPMELKEEPKQKTFGLGDITGTKQKTKMAERILAKYKGKPGVDAAKYVDAVLNIGSFAVTDLNERKVAEIVASLTPEDEKKKIEVGGSTQ